MPQFSIYKNNERSTNKTYPYFIDVQNDLLSDLNSRLVIPLTTLEKVNNTDVERLCPLIPIDKGEYVLLTHQMTSVPASILKTEVTTAEKYRYEILGAIDMLISGI